MLKVFSVATLTIWFAACSQSPTQYHKFEGKMLGTQYHITAQLDRHGRESLIEQIPQLDSKMKSEMSIFDPKSLLSQINRRESFETTQWIEMNIRLADSISRLSDGAYDITVAPLVEAWGFGASENRHEMLSQHTIDSLLQFVGYEGVELLDGQIRFRDERMQIDLNSIAKGFAVDRLADIVESLSAKNYMVDIGGELRLGGTNPNGDGWRVGIETPFDGNMSEGDYLEQRLLIEPNDKLRGVATSGNYRRFYTTKEGKRVVHTIDPKSGWSRPSTLLSATVLAPTCALADGYATMIMASGDGAAQGLVESIEGCEAYLIYSTGDQNHPYRVWYSEGMREKIMDRIE